MERASTCEELLLKIIWESGKPELSTKEVIDGFKGHGKDYARTTVVTFAQRLIEKKCLASRRIGKQSYLRPLITEEEYRMMIVRQIVNFWFDGDRLKMVAEIQNMQ